MPIGIGAAILGSAGISGAASILGGRSGSKALSAGMEEASLRAAMARRAARQQFAPYQAAGKGAITTLDRIYNQGDLDPAEVFRQTPQYNFLFEEGQRALERSAAAGGMLTSGNTGRALQQFGQGLASTAYDSYINRLFGLADRGQAATGSVINAEMGAAAMQGNAAMQNGFGQAQIAGDMYANIADTGNAAVGNYMFSNWLNQMAPQGTSSYGTTYGNTAAKVAPRIM